MQRLVVSIMAVMASGVPFPVRYAILGIAYERRQPFTGK